MRRKRTATRSNERAGASFARSLRRGLYALVHALPWERARVIRRDGIIDEYAQRAARLHDAYYRGRRMMQHRKRVVHVRDGAVGIAL